MSNLCYEFGPFRLDTGNVLLLRDGAVVPLQRKAFDMLLLLVQHPERVLSKDELLERLWPDTVVEESNLTQNVYLLRKALGEMANGQPYIVTVSGRGYRFAAEVRQQQAAPELLNGNAPVHNPAEVASSTRVEQRAALSPPVFAPRSKVVFGLLPVLLLALAGGLYWRYRSNAKQTVVVRPIKVKPFTTFPGRESQPVFSPDGKQLAFVWTGEQDQNADLYVKLIDLGPALRLTTDPASDYGAVFSPDGKQLAFLRQKGNDEEVLLISALGGVERKLGQVAKGQGWMAAWPNQLDWSPDGQWLAVTDAPEEKSSIFLLAVATGEKRRITFPPAQSFGDLHPAFSPDGATIAFARSVSSGVQHLYQAPAAGGTARLLASNNGSLYGLAWAADGQSVIFSAPRTANVSLWRVAVAGGAPEPVEGAGGEAYEIAVARRGDNLAYAHRLVDTNIWRLELAATRAQRPTPTQLIASSRLEGSAQYSPDGQKIAFASDRTGNWEIWVCARDGADALQLTVFDGPQTGSPRWSPDGQWIAFDSRITGNSEILVISAQGGQARRLTTDPAADVVPSWSRDGQWIYFCSNRSGERQLWKMPAAGGQAVQITRQGGFEAAEAPAGQFLYYAKRSQDGIFQVPVAGGAEQLVPELSAAGYYRNWTLTDAGIYFIPHAATSRQVLNFFSFATRQVRQVAALERLPANAESGLAASPDGRWLLYARADQVTGDIMLVENFR